MKMQRLILVLALFSALFIAGCGDGTPPKPAANDPNSKANAGTPGMVGGGGAPAGGATSAAAGATE